MFDNVSPVRVDLMTNYMKGGLHACNVIGTNQSIRSVYSRRDSLLTEGDTTADPPAIIQVARLRPIQLLQIFTFTTFNVVWIPNL